MTPFPSYAQVPLAHAPDKPSETLELIKEEESVSIAARHEQPISQAPQNVYVITDEDIRQSGAIDIPTILRRIPGMEVIQMTGAHFDVSVRGDNQARANKLLVLVDGRSIYLDMQGEVLWKAIPVTLPEIKRIEVLKGPASALYGFNAFDGVVNIITKSADEMKGTTLQVAGGEFGTLLTSAIHAGSKGKFGYRLSASQEQTSQWRSRDSLAFRDYKFNIDTTYALNNSSNVRLSGGLLDSNRYDGPIATNGVMVAQRPIIGYFNGVYERPNFFLRAWYTHVDQDDSQLSAFPTIARFFQPFADNKFNPVRLQSWDSYNIESQHALEFWSTNRFTYGFNYRHNAFSSSGLSQYTTEDRLGFYVQDEWRIIPSVTVVGGVRYDLDTFINPTVSPRFSIIYTPIQDHTFRFSASVAYRPPTVFETATNSTAKIFLAGCPSVCTGPSVLNTALVGSANLAPEQIISYDAGYQGWYLKHRLRLRADLFFNHLSDLIGDATVARNTGSFVNGKETDIYGGEVGFEFLATSWLTGFANYSHQEFGQGKSNTNSSLRGGPRHKANAGLRGDWENGLNGEVSVNYVSSATYPISSFFFTAANLPGGVPAPDVKVGSYTLLNLRGAYRFWHEKRTGREAEIAVSAFNSLNDRHKEHPLADTIGSRVMGWLTIKY